MRSGLRCCGLHMCDGDGPTRESLLDEMEKILSEPVGGMKLGELRSQMSAAYAEISGEELGLEGVLGDKPMPRREIDLEQFTALLASTRVARVAPAHRYRARPRPRTGSAS